MEVTGSSKITYYSDALKRVVTELLGRDPQDLVIKLDSRANVKGSYGKFIPAQGEKKAEIRIYTGAIVSPTSDTTWEDLFIAGEDAVESASDALVFMIVYLLKKYLRGVAFEIKTGELDPRNSAPLKAEPDYVDVNSKFVQIKSFYEQLIASSPSFSLGTARPQENLNVEALNTDIPSVPAENVETPTEESVPVEATTPVEEVVTVPEATEPSDMPESLDAYLNEEQENLV